jgi:hypothetical protein
MVRALTLLALLSTALAGCGLTETGAAAGAGAEAQAQQAAAAARTEQQVKQQIDAAYSQAAQQRRAADTEGQ